ALSCALNPRKHASTRPREFSRLECLIFFLCLPGPAYLVFLGASPQWTTSQPLPSKMPLNLRDDSFQVTRAVSPHFGASTISVQRVKMVPSSLNDRQLADHLPLPPFALRWPPIPRLCSTPGS